MRYRYKLHRIIDKDKSPHVLFIGLNPSEATELLGEGGKNDPTISKLIRMVGNWHGSKYGGFYVGNIFPVVETKYENLPKLIQMIPEDCMRENIKALKEMKDKCDLVVFCWGARGNIDKKRKEEILEMFPDGHHLGKPTSNHQPRHPLYQSERTTPEPYRTSQLIKPSR